MEQGRKRTEFNEESRQETERMPLKKGSSFHLSKQIALRFNVPLNWNLLTLAVLTKNVRDAD